MRIKLYFTLENTKIPIDYRRSIISFIKLSLSEYSKEEFQKYYNQKDNIIKPYTFSIFFRQPQNKTGMGSKHSAGFGMFKII